MLTCKMIIMFWRRILQPDHYIVRIYRREARDHLSFVGVLELVGNGARHSFTNSDELWNLICEHSMFARDTDRDDERRRG